MFIAARDNGIDGVDGCSVEIVAGPYGRQLSSPFGACKGSANREACRCERPSLVGDFGHATSKFSEGA